MAGPTLRQRAIAALARRDYSRADLERKLHAYAENAAELAGVLDILEREHWLSTARFAEGFARRRASGYGRRRIAAEFKQHGVNEDVAGPELATLALTEIERCRAVWQKKFGCVPKSLRERARQVRFLEARGFDGDCIRKVISGEP